MYPLFLKGLLETISYWLFLIAECGFIAQTKRSGNFHREALFNLGCLSFRLN